MPLVASQHTRVTLDANRTISTGSIRVDGIVVSNAGAAVENVAFTDNDDTAILNITVPIQDSKTLEVPWIAENGLKITSAGEILCVVTVLHSAVGA